MKKYIIHVIKIGEIGDKKTAYGLVKLFKWGYCTDVLHSIRKVFGELGDEKAAIFLTEKIDHYPYWLHEPIISTIRMIYERGKREGEKIAKRLIKTLCRETMELKPSRRAIIRLIGHLGGETVLKPLEDILSGRKHYFWRFADEYHIKEAISTLKNTPTTSSREVSSSRRTGESRSPERV